LALYDPFKKLAKAASNCQTSIPCC